MTVLDVLHPILPEQLNSRYYFQSLMERAHLCGLLSDQELSKIQTELLIILAEQTDKWSQGKSSSIPMEKAQELLIHTQKKIKEIAFLLSLIHI